MKTLVTGGTGFGSKVVNLLVKNGHSVRLFSRYGWIKQPGICRRKNRIAVDNFPVVCYLKNKNSGTLKIVSLSP